MTCERYREALSAMIDGEDTVLEATAIEAHVATCPSCRAFAAGAARVGRATRIAPADPVPDLTEPIMAALVADLKDRRGRQPILRPGPSPAIVRLGLALVALAQLAFAIPGLLGDDSGAPVHVAHEQGSWALALAVALLLAAWRPAPAGGILVLVGVLVTCLTVTMAVDIVAGRTVAAAEAPHMLALLGFGFLWLVAHPEPGPRPRVPAAA
jgi:predicted anti-sigma-YlaC factor YlaD